MANLLDVIRNLIMDTPEGGRGLLTPQNMNDAYNNFRGQFPGTMTRQLQVSQQQPTQIPQSVQQFVQPQQPVQIPNAEVPQESSRVPQGNSNFINLLTQLGIPLAVAGLGIAGKNSDVLPIATGFQGGYVGEQSRKRIAGEELKGKKELLNYEYKYKGEDRNSKEWNESYDMAMKLSQTGPFGQMEQLTPEQIKDLADRIHSIRYGNNQQGSNQNGGLPDPAAYAEGAILKDNGKPIKVKRNGKWQDTQ